MNSDNTTNTAAPETPASSGATESSHSERSTASTIRPGTEGLTTFIKAQDVQRVLACSRATAYYHLRVAAGRSGERGLLRVPAEVWEDYVARTFGGASAPTCSV